MLKKLLAVLAMMYAAASFAAVDVNKATAADLDGIKGIGPGISGKILDERKKGPFKDWNDLITRVNGIGDANAAKFSSEGMTVNGSAFAGAAPAAKKDDKPMAKKDEKPAAKKEEKAAMAKEDKPAAAKEDKKEAKAEKKEEMKAAKEDKAAAKEEKKAAKEDKKEDKKEAVAKADTAKPAASAAKK